MVSVFEATEVTVFVGRPTDNGESPFFGAAIFDNCFPVSFVHLHAIDILTRAASHAHRRITVLKHLAVISEIYSIDSVISATIIPHI